MIGISPKQAENNPIKFLMRIFVIIFRMLKHLIISLTFEIQTSQFINKFTSK